MTAQFIHTLYDLYKNKSQAQLNEELGMACFSGQIENVKYLLTHPEFKDKVDIHFEDDKPLQYASTIRAVEIIKFLLTSPDLKEHANIHAGENHALNMACQRGDLDLVKYLISSPELKENADVHGENAYPLLVACQHGHVEIARYFIFDLNIKKNKYISKFLEKFEGPAFDQVNAWFNLRELNENLHKDLPFNDNIKKNKPKL